MEGEINHDDQRRKKESIFCSSPTNEDEVDDDGESDLNDEAQKMTRSRRRRAHGLDEMSGRARVSAASALRYEGRLGSNPLHALLVTLPVDGGDGRRALQLEISVLEMLLPHFEPQAQHARLQRIVLADRLQQSKQNITNM